MLLLFFVLGFLGVCFIAVWKLPSWSLAQEHLPHRYGKVKQQRRYHDPLSNLYSEMLYSLFGRGPRFSETLWQLNDLPLSFWVPKLIEKKLRQLQLISSWDISQNREKNSVSFQALDDTTSTRKKLWFSDLKCTEKPHRETPRWKTSVLESIFISPPGAQES